MMTSRYVTNMYKNDKCEMLRIHDTYEDLLLGEPISSNNDDPMIN